MECAACGSPMRVEARFCPHCGEETRDSVARSRVEAKASRKRSNRRGLALALGFVGALGSLGLGAWADGDGRSMAFVLAVGVVADLGVGLGVLGILGEDVWARHLGARPRWKDLGLAIPLGALCFGMAYVASDLIFRLFGDGSAEPFSVDRTVVISVLLVAPLLEEWLCRGVFWEACEGVGGERTRIVATAILFAMLHGWNGGFVLELPHRFAGGLLLGWLRGASGSLVPGILAHLVWNSLALATMT